MIIGSVDTADNAINSPQFVPNCPTNCRIATVIGHFSLSVSIVNEYKNSPHANKKLKAAQVRSPGLASGNMTRKKAPHLEQPSIIAASSSAVGIVKKYVLIIKMTNGRDNVIFAIMTPI